MPKPICGLYSKKVVVFSSEQLRNNTEASDTALLPGSEKHTERKLTAKSALVFTACRYVIYGLVFLRGLIVARCLGPYMLGIYGFATLFLQYLAYLGLGIQYAINVELATSSGANDRNIIASATALTALIGSSIVIAGTVVQILHMPMFTKYSFSHYAILVGLIAGATMLQQVYTNIFRVYGKLGEIAVTELFNALLLLLVACIFRGSALIYALLLGWAISGVFAIILFAVRSPHGFPLSIKRSQLWTLLAIGLPLLVYNASFSVITTIAQSAISIYYPVKTLGYYTLATSIASAVLLGFSSISWIVFPSILSRSHSSVPDADAARTADRGNVLFGTGSFLVVFAGVLLLPILFWILPSYTHSREPLVALLLSEAMLSGSFGYNSLAIARKKQMTVAKLSLLSVIFVGISATVIGMNHLPFIWIAVSVLAGSVLFTVLQANLGHRLVGKLKHQMRPILPLGTIASMLLCLGGALLHHSSIGAVVGSLVFCIANRKRVQELWQVCEPHIRSLLPMRATRHEETL
jgi:O-antigen/teichoic acid export membrane protein